MLKDFRKAITKISITGLIVLVFSFNQKSFCMEEDPDEYINRLIIKNTKKIKKLQLENEKFSLVLGRKNKKEDMILEEVQNQEISTIETQAGLYTAAAFAHVEEGNFQVANHLGEEADKKFALAKASQLAANGLDSDDEQLEDHQETQNGKDKDKDKQEEVTFSHANRSLIIENLRQEGFSDQEICTLAGYKDTRGDNSAQNIKNMLSPTLSPNLVEKRFSKIDESLKRKGSSIRKFAVIKRKLDYK